MKKQTILKSLLILLPILAVGLATTTDSVLVFDTLSGVAEYYSYFDLVPVVNLQMLPPLAAMLSLVSGIIAVIYMAKKKEWCLKGILGTTFVSACLVAIPIVQQGEVRVVPNVGLPIFMIIDCLVAYYILKHPDKAEEKKAPRLKKK